MQPRNIGSPEVKRRLRILPPHPFDGPIFPEPKPERLSPIPKKTRKHGKQPVPATRRVCLVSARGVQVFHYGDTLFPEDNPGSILVNLQGKRFFDEAGPIDSKNSRVPQYVVQQKRGMAFLVADQAIYDKVPSSGPMISVIESQGGKVFKADTVAELAGALQDAYGLYAGAFVKTIKDYNAAIDAGTADQLEVPRLGRQFKFAQAPFYAIPVAP